ncbi:exosome catalytic subunit dis3, partial [Ceratobasidium sp. 392]
MADIIIRKRSLAQDGQSSQRKFYKKTARGKVLKVLRERYVRDDIPCGIESCRNCSSFTHASDENFLPATGDLTHSAYPAGHFVVPDTNMDLMESPLFKPPIVLLQTVIDEVRHRSLPLHARLKGLIASEDKKIYVFYNEFHAQTAVVRQAEETPNDRNDRGTSFPSDLLGFRRLMWRQVYVSQRLGTRTTTPTLALLPKRASFFSRTTPRTEDGLRKKGLNVYPVVFFSSYCGENGEVTVVVREYVAGAKDSGALLDLLAAESMEGEPEGMARGGRRKVLFEEYLPQATLIAGVKNGELYQGYFSANAYNYLEGSVNVAGFTKPILLLGREAMNRSVQGDFVVVELLPESEWKAPADAVIDAETARRNDNPDDSASQGGQSDGEEAIDHHERLAARDTAARNPKEKQPTGRVVGVMKRNWRAYVCHIDRSSLSSTSSTTLSAQTVFATPVDRALPRIRLRTRQAPSLLGQKILVSLDRWDSHSRYPDGHFVRALGKAESKEAERESLLLEFDVPYRPFGKAILDCLPKEGDKWIVPPKEGAGPEWRDREDLRDLIICSIDPPNCQDIDDALHARTLPNGNIEAGVHIADVSHFVHPDTPMDNEAAARGTTVYLVDKRIDMLPSLLGTNLCSLRPYVERLAFSAIWELTPDADIVNVRFTKSVIASKAAFTYEEAQIRKDDPTLKDELTQSIRLLNSLAQKLKAKRMAAGALNLASPEVKIHLDSAES